MTEKDASSRLETSFLLEAWRILMINSMAGKPGIPAILMGGWIGLAGLFCVVDLVVDVSFYSIL